MEKNIESFIKIINVNEILLLSEDKKDKDSTLDNEANLSKKVTFIDISNNSNIISKLIEVINQKYYELVIISSDISIKNLISTLSDAYTELPLIIISQNTKIDSEQDQLSKYNLSISPLSENSLIIYNFNTLNSKIDNTIPEPSISKYLDKIYEKKYYQTESTSLFYPISLITHSNKIGGIKNLPLTIKGYKSLKNGDDLNIGYYLRTNNISDCNDVYLHYLFNPENKPNPSFSNENYLKSNPDLKNINYNPFLHYILYGKNENRKINNNLRGALHANIKDNTLKGWIAEIGNDQPIETSLFIDNKEYPIIANIYREDLKRNNINNGKHGFEFKIPEEYKDNKDHKIILNGPNNERISEITYNNDVEVVEQAHGVIKGALQSNIKDTLIKGWIAEIGNDNPVKASIKIGNNSYPVNANIYREDLKRNKINNGEHGFEFRVPDEFIDGNEHSISLVDHNGKIISQIKHTFVNYDYENNIERFFANAMLSPEMVLPPNEPRKKILSLMNNIAKYLMNQVNNEELVSIIMPVYNREDLIGNAINSVLEQSYKNFELIIVNDCSDDNTLDVIKEINDSRIKIINNPTNLGVSKSRNIALNESKGKYIMYLDSDNDWEKDYIKTTVGAFNVIPDADAVYSAQYVYEKDNENLKYIRYGTINKGLLSNRNYIDLNCFSHKRSIYEDYGGFNENFKRFVDWDMILKYMTYGKVYSVPFLMSNYYFNIADNSISNKAEYLEQQEEVHKKQMERLENKKYDINVNHGISVIIPSYESLDDLKECLNSLFNLEASWLEIIVVDNNSSEDVIRYLLKLKDENKIKLILNTENVGFTYAVNQGIEISNIENDIVLLNNDAIVTDNALQLLQEAAYELDNCGMTVPQQVLPGNTKTINTHVPFANQDYECDVNLSAHHKNIINVPLYHNGEYTELSFAPFFCVYIKRETYNMSLGLDAELGRHFRSDMIYCNYVRAVLNQKIYHVSEARVYHKLQQATKTLKEKSMKEHDLLYVQNRWSEEEQEKYGFKRAKWDY